MVNKGTMEATFGFVRDHIKVRAQLKNVPSWINVTTITMVTTIGTIPDIRNFSSFMETPRKAHPYTFEWVRKPTDFFNQVTIKTHDGFTNKSVKIFSNGSIQATGCTDPLDCERILDQIFTLFRMNWEGFVAPPGKEYRIVMINTNFSLGRSLNLRQVHQSSIASGNMTQFDPDRYSAVKIKIATASKKRFVTCSVFSTGKVIMTGAESLEQILQCYVNVVPLLIPCLYGLQDKKQDSIPSFLGYTWNQWERFFSDSDIKNV